MAESRNKNLIKAISNALVNGKITTAGVLVPDIVEDTTPQLGGNLDVNGSDIVSTSDGNIDILPNGAGKVNLDGNGSTGGITVSDGLIEMRTGTGSVAAIDMYCESSNAHKVTLKPPPHADYSGNVTFQLPSSNGTNGYVLQTNGSGVTSWVAQSGGGLTGFTSADNTSSPNDTVNAASLTVDSSSTNADIVLEPKGTGAFLSHIPGGDAATGNKRGAFAIDLQLNRTDGTPAADNVPSAYMSTIIGGYDNKIAAAGSGTDNTNSGTLSRCTIIGSQGSEITTSSGTQYQVKEGTIIGSKNSTIGSSGASALQSTIIGGSTNTINGGYRGAIFSGSDNTLGNGNYSTIVGGWLHNLNGSYNNITGGRDHQIDSTAIYSGVHDGYFNEIEGDYSSVLGGYSHFIDDPAAYSAIVAGYDSTMDGDNSFIAGGYQHDMRSSAYSSAIVGGYQHIVEGDYAFVGGGRSHFIDDVSIYSGIVGGYDHNLDGDYSFIGGGNAHNSIYSASNYIAIIGGLSHTIWDNSSHSAIVGGTSGNAAGYATVTLGGTHGHSKGVNGTVVIPGHYSLGSDVDDGEFQQTYRTLTRITTDATPVDATTGGNQTGTATNQARLYPNSAHYFKISLVANVTAAGDTKVWTFEGAVKIGATNSTIALIGTPSKNIIAQDSGASTWDADVGVDTTNGCVKVTCTGQASTTIRWCAKVAMTEVAF